jgi:tetratricopeptide (TPR) repeat protein
MNNLIKNTSISLIIIFIVLGFATIIYAQNQQTLNQYVSDLQKNPSDYALREKIIKHVQGMRPAPKTPEEVDELVGQAKYVFKHAKTQEDYLGAVDAYKKIVNITPWVGDYYFNLGVAQEQAGQPRDAINSFKLYLLASPDAKDAREVRERIGGLKYAAEKATKESIPTAIAAKKQNTFEDLLKKIDGRRYTYATNTQIEPTMEVRGDVFVFGVIRNGIYEEYTQNLSPHVVIRGLKTTWPNIFYRKNFEFLPVEYTYIISEDGDRITQRHRHNDGDVREFIYYWKR